LVARLVERTRSVVQDDPSSWDTDVGPLVSAAQRDRVEGYIRSGLEEGATLAVGGGRPSHLAKGYFVEPTIFTDVRNDMRIAQDEIFGPVLSIIRYDDIDEAVRQANDTVYGLAATVWSTDYVRAVELAKRLRAGTVWINDHHMINPRAPFGGYKQSGLGRELGEKGLDEFTELKHVHVDLAGRRDRKVYGLVLGH
jgi:aldehyde dehydrogenase (NAD+)